MGLLVVTATVNGTRKALWRGRLVSVANATHYSSPSSAQKAMSSAQKAYGDGKVFDVVGWKIEPVSDVVHGRKSK